MRSAHRRPVGVWRTPRNGYREQIARARSCTRIRGVHVDVAVAYRLARIGLSWDVCPRWMKFDILLRRKRFIYLKFYTFDFRGALLSSEGT